MITARNLHKSYPGPSGDVAALRGVSLELRPGDFAALVGPSGCGKSTLLHILGGLDTATSGEVCIDDTPLAALSDSRLSRLRRSRVGFVFQFFNLLPALSALENIALPALLNGEAPRQAAARARELLERVGLGHRADHRAHQLSGGEMQRVAIARALVNRPAIVLADEPTGNLDTETSAGILRLLRDTALLQDAALLVATHSPEIAASAGRILRMRDGGILNPTAL